MLSSARENNVLSHSLLKRRDGSVLFLVIEIVLATACSARSSGGQQRPPRQTWAPTLDCTPRPAPLLSAESAPCPALPDLIEGTEPPSCVPPKSRGRQILPDTTTRMRVFRACDRAHGWSELSASRSSVMMEWIGPPRSSGHKSRGLGFFCPGRGWDVSCSFEGGTNLDDKWEGEITRAPCPSRGGGPDPDSAPAPEDCVRVQVTTTDLVDVIGALVRLLDGGLETCLPMTVDLGVPEGCLLRMVPVPQRGS
jgi:hypothetical protein